MSLKVGVIIPTYNRANLIGETLRSILDQSHKPAEIIVVDDGSTDQTEAVVRQFGPKISYVKIENSGECRARNVGVAASSNSFVAFCDSDDVWKPEKLALQARLFEKQPSLQYSFTNFASIVNNIWSSQTKFDTSPLGYWDMPNRSKEHGLFIFESPLCEKLLIHQPIFPSTLMMKREFFDSVGQWNEALGRTPSVDLEFHFRCVSHSPIGIVSLPVVGIRKHATNFSGDVLRTTLGEIEVLRFLLSHNTTARMLAAPISTQITLRTIAVAERAFLQGDLKLTRTLFSGLELRNPTLKVKIKSLIANSPSLISSPARQLAMFIAR